MNLAQSIAIFLIINANHGDINVINALPYSRLRSFEDRLLELLGKVQEETVKLKICDQGTPSLKNIILPEYSQFEITKHSSDVVTLSKYNATWNDYYWAFVHFGGNNKTFDRLKVTIENVMQKLTEIIVKVTNANVSIAARFNEKEIMKTSREYFNENLDSKSLKRRAICAIMVQFGKFLRSFKEIINDLAGLLK